MRQRCFASTGVLALVVIFAALTACAPAPTPVPTLALKPTEVPKPTAAIAQPTATSKPTEAPKPTAAPAEPTTAPKPTETKAPDWPAKDITLVVPFTPGGGYDLQARIVAPFIQKYLPLKVNVIVKNSPGAGGKIGAMEVAKSKPDGYTIGLVGGESVAFMKVMAQIEEDPRNWTWLGRLSLDPLMVAIPTNGSIKSVADMKSKDFRFGVTSEMLPSAALVTKIVGGKYRPVLFDGSSDATLAGMRGDVDMNIFSWPSMAKGVKNSEGKLASMFVVSKTRIPEVKDVPTLAELGVQVPESAYAVLATSRNIMAPAGLDKRVEEILRTALAKAVADPEFVAQMKKAEYAVATATSDEVKTDIKEAIDLFEGVKDLVTSYVK